MRFVAVNKTDFNVVEIDDVISVGSPSGEKVTNTVRVSYIADPTSAIRDFAVAEWLMAIMEDA